MFGKKPATPRPMWALQLLTTQYVVDGLVAGDDPDAQWFLSAHYEEGRQPLTLAQARVQPVGGLSVVAPGAARWVVSENGECVAAVPRDDASLAYATAHLPNPGVPIPSVVVLAGPYAIRGTVYSADKTLRGVSTFAAFAMWQVVIDCLAPGAQLKGLAAPYLVVRTAQLHGIMADA